MKGKIATNLGCLAIVLLINLGVGGWSVSYLLTVLLSKTIPFWGAALIGLFVGEFSIPIAVVVALLRHFGAI